MNRIKYLAENICEFETIIQEFGGELIGCSEQEISNLESRLPPVYKLPIAYKEFLLYGGKRMGNLFRGIDISYSMVECLLKNQYRDIIQMIKPWDSQIKLPPDLFIINEHLGSNFTYFYLTEGENPPIFWWEEGEGGLEVSVKESDSFSEFLHRKINTYKKKWVTLSNL